MERQLVHFPKVINNVHYYNARISYDQNKSETAAKHLFNAVILASDEIEASTLLGVCGQWAVKAVTNQQKVVYYNLWRRLKTLYNLYSFEAWKRCYKSARAIDITADSYEVLDYTQSQMVLIKNIVHFYNNK